MRIREDSDRLSQKPTVVLIFFNLLVYAALSILGRSLFEIDSLLLTSYGQVNLYVLEGEFWRVFTSLFVHANLVHLLGNMFFLLIFGLRAEELFGKAFYCVIYFSSGLVGNLLTLLWGPYMVSVGASGAIFGVFGASVIYIRRNFGQSIVGALIYSFYLFIMNVGANVNLLAHFGGLAAGLILGYLLGLRGGLEA